MRFAQIFAVLVSIAGISSALQEVAPRDGSSGVGLAERDEALAEILARAADLLSGGRQLDARAKAKKPGKTPDKTPAKATTAAAPPVKATTSVQVQPTTSVAAQPPPTTSAVQQPPTTSVAQTTSVSSQAVTSVPTTSIPTTLATVTTSASSSSEAVSEPAAESTCTPNAKKGRGLFGLGKPGDGCSDDPGTSTPFFPIGGNDNSTDPIFKKN